MPKRTKILSAITTDSLTNDRAPEKDPDNLKDNAFTEIDAALAEDVRTKDSAYGSRSHHADAVSLSRLANEHDASVMEDGMKKKLAMRTSAAISIPGAFDSDGRPLPKPSQEILRQRARDLKEEKKRQQAMEKYGPIISADNEEVPLDNLQLRMNDFIDFINKEDREAQEERKKQQRRRRGRIVVFCVVGLIVTIAIIVVGVVVGTGGSRSGNYGETTSGSSPTPVPTKSFEAGLIGCVFHTNETDQSERYYEVWAAIVSEHPDTVLSIASINSAARMSLCWLVYADALQVDVILGEEYQVIQRFVLALIYFHFAGASGTSGTNALEKSNWLTPAQECEWDFLVCDADASDEVQRLELSTTRLRGPIPSELALLTKLSHIDFDRNYLTGQIPLELWTMTQLEVLSLHSNRLAGTFPNELINLTGLKRLILSGSLIIGTLPDMSALTHMEGFYLYEAFDVTGAFPDMSGWTNLGELELNLIEITGTLPTYIGSLSNLTKFHIGRTSLTGTMPSELGSLVNLGHLDLVDGDLSGSIPSELGYLTELSILNFLGSPFVTGTIPTELGRLSNLESFDVTNCRDLTGTMPTELCELQRAKSLVTLAADCKQVLCDCCTRCKSAVKK